MGDSKFLAWLGLAILVGIFVVPMLITAYVYIAHAMG
jgi:hypothetical protein